MVRQRSATDFLSNDRLRAAGVLILAATVLAPGLAQAAPRQQAAPPSPQFKQVWERTDYPVLTGKVARSWIWGPGPNATKQEPNAETPGGLRQVQYYDKSRMEINDPRADPSSRWYVTNGLLVVEMVSGRLQLGATRFEQRAPARVPVAGDTIGAGPGVVAPTYASLASVASVDSDHNRAKNTPGAPVTATLGPDGTVGSLQFSAGSLPRDAYYADETGHNVPDVFWDFMNSSGLVYEGGQYKQGKIIDWLYALGYPITEPYWIDIRINSKPVRVMMQAFQRRILTYNPQNEAAWRVEMGNVGMQYYEWRYGTSVGPTPTPAPGGIALTTTNIQQPGIFRSGQYSAIHESLYTVLTNQKAWSDLWIQHTALTDQVTQLPAVDFNRNFVLAAFWGDKPNGCYHLGIKGATLQGKTIQVSVQQVMQAGMCPQVITQPNDFAVVSAAGLSPGQYTVEFVDGAGATLQTVETTLP